jgi:galactose mutarotase-like enzyme
MKVQVIPTRGNGIWRCEFNHKPFSWPSPVNGPVHPMYVPLTEASGLGWLEGFDEMLVRCGLISNGAPEHDAGGRLVYPLHGRIANLPADLVSVEVDEEKGCLKYWGEVEETRFHFHRLRLTTEMELSLDSNILTIKDKVTNLSGRQTAIQMLYHSNFSPPGMKGGWLFHAPVKRLVPRNEHAAAGIGTWSEFADPGSEYSEEVYFMSLHADAKHKTMVLLDYATGRQDPEQAQGVSIEFDVRQLPCFTLWKNTVDAWDGYVAGLEPGTNFPNPRSFEESRGRAVLLDAGQSHKMELKIGFLTGAEQIAAARATVEGLAIRPAEISPVPDPQWCA